MSYVIALFATLARLCRPTRGVHAPALGYLREVCVEARAYRVRRYAANVPTTSEEVPQVPAPRRPVEVSTAFSPARPSWPAREVQPQAQLVRTYFVAHEARTLRTTGIAA